MQLKTLKEEIGSEWRYGVSLIPENYFEASAKSCVKILVIFQRNCRTL